MERIDLYRMRRLNRETLKIRWRIEREKSKAERATSCPAVAYGGRGYCSRVEEGVITITDLKDAYRESMAELERMRAALEPVIDLLPDTDERAVMRLRYLKGYSAEEIAEDVYLTDRMVYYILKRAEKRLERMYPDLITARK